MFGKKNKLGKELDGLISLEQSQGSDLIGRMMLARLTFGVDSSKTFKNSEEQVDSFLKKYPSMVLYRDKIIAKCQEFRKKNKLPEEKSDDTTT
jgi:hypothetical protein